jgi:vWA-MoxR associated protein C-terminal domain
MTVARPNRMSPVAAATSALVVGIESYDITGAGADLPGSAKLAARFAVWLLDRKICLPERITLMTAYDQAAYGTGGRYEPELSPVGEFSELEKLSEPFGTEVNWHPHANASDFGKWINSAHAPREKDAFFLLFWVGHGFTHPGLRDRRLCLLASDAGDYQLAHVELMDLLNVVTEIAPEVHEVAFVNTCRAPVTTGWERRLLDGWRPITPPAGPTSPGGPHPASEQSIVFAAAHGQTTKMAGWQDRTFADVLLEKLDALPPGAGPLAVFDDDLKSFGDRIAWRPSVTTFGYFHDRTERLDTPPQDDSDLTYDEWRRLVKIARRIDGGRKTRWDVRLGAYCQAVGLEEVLGLDMDNVTDRPRSPGTLEELIGVLRNRPSTVSGLPPPLVVACEFVANLPTPDSRSQLAKWCAAWANTRGDDGRLRLDNARERRPCRLPGKYLSILINEVYDPRGLLPVGQERPSRRYRLSALLWAMDGPFALRGDGWGSGGDAAGAAPGIIADEVADAAARLIGQADRCDVISERSQTLVEFVLPRELLGRRLEYEGATPLGFLRPIVFRDLDRLRRPDKSTARNQAELTRERIDKFEADRRRSPWSKRIRWFTCRELDSVKRIDISGVVSEKEIFCVALEHGDNGSVSRDGADADTPRELIYSVDSGAAIVVSLNYENHSGSCALSSSSQADGSILLCQMPKGRDLVVRSVNDMVHWKGLPDLPYIARQIRSKLHSAGLQIGVLMEDKSRLWPSYDQSAGDAQAGSN